MPKLVDGSPLTNAQWLFSLVGLPNVYWTTVSEVSEATERGEYADPISGTKRYAPSGINSIEPITITKTFLDGSQVEGDNWEIIKFLKEAKERGRYLSGSLSPYVLDGGLTLRGSASIQMENMMVQSYTVPGEIDRSDGSVISTISATLTVEMMSIKS